MVSDSHTRSRIETHSHIVRQQLYGVEKAYIASLLTSLIPVRSSIFAYYGTPTQAVADAIMQHKLMPVMTKTRMFVR